MNAPDDIAGLIERLNARARICVGHEIVYDEQSAKTDLEAAAALSALSEENKRLRAAFEETVNEAAGWREDAVCAEAQVRELRTALEPFVGYLDQAVFDLDNNGNPLPDDQGVGWVYLTHGHFRRARATLKSTEPKDV